MAVTLQSIIRDAERAVRVVDELFNDTAHWNRLHPDEAPLDPDPDGEMQKVKQYAHALIKECRRPRGLREPINVSIPLPNSVKARLDEEEYLKQSLRKDQSAMKRNAIAVLNEIARIELSGPKRHRHDWQTNQRLERGTTVLFICAACPKTKTVRIPTIEERKAELRKRWSK